MLAGELSAAEGDIHAAFARYETLMRPYATLGQQGAKNVGRFFAPRTRHGLMLRNHFYRVMTSRPLIRQFEKLVKASASNFALPRYPHLGTWSQDEAAGRERVPLARSMQCSTKRRTRCRGIRTDKH